MQLNQIDSLTLNKNGLLQNEQDGSLLTVDNPIDHHNSTILKVDAEIEKFSPNKSESKIPVGFFSHVHQNKIKYNY